MILWPDALLLLCFALIVDAIVGDPDWLWRRVAHPVVLLGGLISASDRLLNQADRPPFRRRVFGISAIAALSAGLALVGYVIEALLREIPGGPLVIVGLAAALLAQHSLYVHVRNVNAGFESGGLTGARHALSMIVGRDVSQLNESGVSRAAIESCAENFSDGVVAPAFWFALFGLPGIVVYKFVNTADSMIGHRNERYEQFGFGAARLDDLLNLIPARLSGLLVALSAVAVGGSSGKALVVMRRDARAHRSPNAGWPESAMAGALGIALSGPRVYGVTMTSEPWLNADGREANRDDIRRALRVYLAAAVLHAGLYGLLAPLLR